MLAVEFYEQTVKYFCFRKLIDATYSDPDSCRNKYILAVATQRQKLQRKVLYGMILMSQQSALKSKQLAFKKRRQDRIKMAFLDALQLKLETRGRRKTEKTLLLKVFLQWKEFYKNNRLLKSYLIEERQLTESSLELPQKNTQKERFLNILMPQLGKYSQASISRSRYLEMSDRGLEDAEDHSNSFADFKSAI